MNAILINNFGDPGVISIGAAAIRDPLPGEVVVRVEVAGANPLDLAIIAGRMQKAFPVDFPYTPGTDFSGFVEAVGAQVIGLGPGDRVFGRAPPGTGGAFGKRLVIAAADLFVIPAEMSFEQAAAVPTVFGTARQALFDAGRLQPGERVLIHAGAGGVGGMAVQQARRAGAYVIATASAGNVEHVKGLGADEVINYRIEDFALRHEIDLVLDTIGGETLERSWAVLGNGGRIVSLVESGIEPRNGHEGKFVSFAGATPFLPEAIREFQAGRLRVVIDSIFPLQDVHAALEKLATGHARGKVLVRVGSAGDDQQTLAA